jgi:hypothetical protein
MRLLGFAVIAECCSLAIGGCSIHKPNATDLSVSGIAGGRVVLAAYDASGAPAPLLDLRSAGTSATSEDGPSGSDYANAIEVRPEQSLRIAQINPPRVPKPGLGPVTSGTFADGTIANLDVSAPWWSWLTLGMIQPIRGTLTVYQNKQELVRQWWCIWLCKEQQTVKQPTNAQAIIIQSLAFDASINKLDPKGPAGCKVCSAMTLSVDNAGIPPPWLYRGSGYHAVGFRGSATYFVGEIGGTLVLHDHWGDDSTGSGPALPADFQ